MAAKVQAITEYAYQIAAIRFDIKQGMTDSFMRGAGCGRRVSGGLADTRQIT